jgi:hypothetical protein
MMKRNLLPLAVASTLALGGALLTSAQAAEMLDGTSDPMTVTDPQVLRAVVRAEAVEWVRLGLDHTVGDEPAMPTPQQERLIRIAGLRAEAKATGASFDPSTVPPVPSTVSTRPAMQSAQRIDQLRDAELRDAGGGD